MIKIEINNLDKLLKMAEKYPAKAEKHVDKAIKRSLVRVLGEEKKEAPFGVSGNLRDNWLTRFGRFNGSLTSNSPYAVAVHEGTTPHYVSPSALMAWAKKKGLNPFAVSKSIAKKGTKANPFFQRAVDNSEESINKDFDKALDDLVKDIANDINN